MTDETATPRPPVALGVWAMGALALLLHVVTANGYGIFRDELYYIACSKELALGYVDQPPFSIVLLAAWRAIFGESLFALRLPPGLAHAATAVVFGFIARELGAARFGQSLAALLAALLPVYLGTSSFYSMNAFDVLFWALLIFVLCRIIATQNAKLWLVFGVIAGLGVQNKFSVAFLAIALAAGIVLTMQWKYLRSPYPYIGGAIAFLIFLPHVYWMHSTDWVTLEFMRNASSMKNAATNPLKYFLDQLLMAHPLYLPIWIAGIVYLFRAQSLRAYRIYAVMFVFLFFFFSLTNGKSYYLAPAYSLVLPAGALAIERFAQRRGAWFRPAALALAALAGLIIAPMAVPLLSPEGILRYEQALGLKPPRDEKGHDAALGQHFADRFGWKELAENVAKAYNALPESDRAKCAIICSNYGEAAAIDFFGRELGLPQAIATHNNYWLWGPRNASEEIIMAVGSIGADFARRKMFDSGGEVARSVHPLAEQGEIRIYVYRNLKPPDTIEKLWPLAKNMI